MRARIRPSLSIRKYGHKPDAVFVQQVRREGNRQDVALEVRNDQEREQHEMVAVLGNVEERRDLIPEHEDRRKEHYVR